MGDTKKPDPRRVITGVVRVSYEHLWEPDAMDEGQEKKYGANFLIPKSDKVAVKRIQAAIAAAEQDGITGKAVLGDKIPTKNFWNPLRDGDEEREGDEVYEGHFYINAKSKTQPQMIMKNGQRIVDPELIYSGVYVRASISFFPYNAGGKKGIGAGLNSIMFEKHGENLGGGSSAEEDFADFIDPDAEVE